MKHRDKLSPSPAAVTHPPAPLASWLIRRAARQALPGLVSRLEEEWLADLSAQSGLLAQVRFALGCCWATQVIAHDPIVFGATARGTVAGHGTLAAFAPGELSPGSSRSTVVMLVLALHVAVIYAFLTGLIHTPGPAASPPPIQGTIFSDPKPTTTPPPGPKVHIEHWHTVDPVYHPNYALPPLTGESVESEQVPNKITSVQAHHTIRILGGPGAGFPDTSIYYPPASRRAEETGAVAVRVCVDDHGRLAGDPTIADSSRNPRLDGGALALARAGSGHYRSTTEDGRPVSSCYAFRVRFQMR